MEVFDSHGSASPFVTDKSDAKNANTFEAMAAECLLRDNAIVLPFILLCLLSLKATWWVFSNEETMWLTVRHLVSWFSAWVDHWWWSIFYQCILELLLWFPSAHCTVCPRQTMITNPGNVPWLRILDVSIVASMQLKFAFSRTSLWVTKSLRWKMVGKQRSWNRSEVVGITNPRLLAQ